MQYRCRGMSSDVPGSSSVGPLFDDTTDDLEGPRCLLGDGRGDASALLPWIDDATPAPTPTPAAKPATTAPPAAGQGLRLDLKNKELRGGNPDDPNAGYFLASAKEQGARWRTSEGGFTGKIDKTGLDTRVLLGEHDQLHGTISAAEKSGALAWERDGKNQGELYGRYGSGSDWEAGLRRTWALDSGALTTGLRHQVTGEGATDGIYGAYKSSDGKTTLDGDAGVRDGGFVGHLTGRHTFDDKSSINGALAHDEQGTSAALGGTYGWDGGSLTANADIARRATGVEGSLSAGLRSGGLSLDGRYSHTPTDDALSLGGSYKLNERDILTGSIAHDGSGTVGTLGGTHTWDGGSLSGNAELANKADGLTTTLSGAYKNRGLSLDGMYKHAPGGDAFSLGGTYATEHDSITGSLAHDKDGTSAKLGGTHTWDGGSLSGSLDLAQRADGFSGGISGAYKDGPTTLEGSYRHTPQKDALAFSGAYNPSDNFSLSGRLGYERNADGTQQGTLGFSEKYRSPNLVHGIDLDAGAGTRNFLSTTGSIDGRLANNLYAGAWGNATVEGGKHTTGQLGASLTYLPSDKTALTAAAMINDRGQPEARLELDILKKAIKDTPDLVDRRNDAPVSLFLSYSKGGTRALDDRYGAPQLEAGKGGMISGGIRIKF